MVEHSGHLQKGEKAWLPVREEQYRLDANELKEGLERLEAVVSGFVEKDQAVERYRHGDVVDQGNPKVPVFQFQDAVLAEVVFVEDDLNNWGQGFDQNELQSRLLYSSLEKPLE